MNKLSIPCDGVIFIGDGHKALLLRNDGDEKFPHLTVDRVVTHPNPPSREQGSDRPNRVFKRAGTNVRAAIAMTDWHDLEEHRFARDIAAALERVVRSKSVPALVVVAPPRTLADLRQAFHNDVKKKIVAEIDKDLTKHTMYEIQKHIFG